MNLPDFFTDKQSEQNFNNIFLVNKHLTTENPSALQLGAWTGKASKWIASNLTKQLTDVDLWDEEEYKKTLHINVMVKPEMMPSALKEYTKKY